MGFVTPWNNRGYDIVYSSVSLLIYIGKMVSQIYVGPLFLLTDDRMVSPVWYNIRRVGQGTYTLTGEHDVDISWMKQVRSKDSQGDTVGRILPRFAAEAWDKEAYEEIITNQSALQELTNLILAQITYAILLVWRLM